MKKFRYLGSMLAEDGELDAEVDLRIQASWKNWRKLSGVLCNRRLSSRLKGIIFKTVVRSAMTYGTETWAIKKSHKTRMDVAEMKMLRWVQGVTRWDKIRNEEIQKRMKVTEIHRKIQEKRLGWYGHVSQRKGDHVTKQVLRMEILGRRQPGRPKRRWMDCIEEDILEENLRTTDAIDCTCWKRLIKNGNPA